MRAPFALVPALSALVACSPVQEHGGFGQAPPPAASAAPSPPAPDRTDPPQLVRVSAPGGLRFEPGLLRVESGMPAEFELANRDRQEHTFVISELAVLMLAGAGQTVSSEVAISERISGRFAFYCSIGGHRDAGMEGVVLVR